jgi:hypothetical protein
MITLLSLQRRWESVALKVILTHVWTVSRMRILHTVFLVGGKSLMVCKVEYIARFLTVNQI